MFDHNNYQLYRSNVRLAGQMKYDLVVNTVDNNIVVSDFHITPVSDLCPFNRHAYDTLLNNSHRVNVMRYYKQVSGSFYKDFSDPLLKSPYPIISNGEEFIKNHDDTFESGCKRMRNYSLYGKQFEFFCPIWLEKLSENQTLSFRFDVYGDEQMTYLISSRELALEPKTAEYHNKFVDYFKQYLKDVGIDQGNGMVMNILPNKNYAAISGLQVSTGESVTKTLPNLVLNIFKREIPLMEFDNQIIRNFEDNKLITNQLFNFNLCFNLEDILSPRVAYMLQKADLYLKVTVGIDGEDLERRDLYTNYEYIPKKSCDIPELEYKNGGFVHVNGIEVDPNVLTYLSDHKATDFILANKISPQTIHWSLAENNSYIFNMYNGFGGYYTIQNEDGKLEPQALSHVYDNSSNILLDKNVQAQNSLTWCNMVKLLIGKNSNINDVVDMLPQLDKYYSTFSMEGCWVNNTKYEGVPGAKGDINILIAFVDTSVIGPIKERCEKFYTVYTVSQEDPCVHVIRIGGKYLFLADDKLIDTDVFVYKQMLSGTLAAVVASKMPEFEKIDQLRKLMSNNLSLKGQSVVVPQTTLDISLASGPTTDTEEVEYYKNDFRKSEYLQRYFGQIKPTFVSVDNDINFNYRYSKQVIAKDSKEFKELNAYSELGYLPTYPSINYYYITKSIEDYRRTEGQSNNIRPWEWKAFDVNKVKMLIPEFDVVLSNDERDVSFEQLLDEFFLRVYNINENDVNYHSELRYLRSLYDYKMSFEYAEPSNIKKLNYTTKITLK